MNPTIVQHSGAWVTFTYFNMVAALALILGGIFFLPIDLWIKGYMLMAVMLLVSATIVLSKTIRDTHEASRLVNKIEDAKAEQLLMRIDRNKD